MADNYTDPHLASSALITIDTQNDFTLDGAPAHIGGTQDIIPNMTNLLDIYRNNNQFIIHVIRLYLRDGSNADVCRKQLIQNGKEIVAPDSQGAELVQELKPDSTVRLDPAVLLAGEFQQIGRNEFVMYKPRWGMFYRTQLDGFLQNRAIDTLVFSGCNFPNCPRTSIYEASERDFRIVVIKDAISQLQVKDEEELHNIGVMLLTTQDFQAIIS